MSTAFETLKVPAAFATTDGEEDAHGVETVGDGRLPVDPTMTASNEVGVQVSVYESHHLMPW